MAEGIFKLGLALTVGGALLALDAVGEVFRSLGRSHAQFRDVRLVAQLQREVCRCLSFQQAGCAKELEKQSAPHE